MPDCHSTHACYPQGKYLSPFHSQKLVRINSSGAGRKTAVNLICFGLANLHGSVIRRNFNPGLTAL